MCPYVEDYSRTSDLQIVNELVHPDHGLVASPLPHNMAIPVTTGNTVEYNNNNNK